MPGTHPTCAATPMQRPAIWYTAPMHLSDERYEELMDRAMLDCYGEEEEFSGIFCTLEDEQYFCTSIIPRPRGEIGSIS